MEMRYTLRQKAGVVALDLPRYVGHLAGRKGWVLLRNRADALERAPGGPGVACQAEFSSDLHACHVFPCLGAWALRRALAQWPLRMAEAPPPLAAAPDLTFVIPHWGHGRLPLLAATVRSIHAQEGVSAECVIVDQNAVPEALALPQGVRRVHTPDAPSEGSRSRAFNAGVREARADIVVCHDGDMLAPAAYGREILRWLRDGGCEVVHLQRFLFCLGQSDSELLMSGGAVPSQCRPERVRQNWQGGTVAIRRDSYIRIGGFDESFVGWGGEDREFYDRCRDLKGWRHGYLPFIHLWHAPAAGKEGPERERNLAHMRARLSVPRAERVEALRSQWA